jgi:hypothetical protein
MARLPASHSPEAVDAGPATEQANVEPVEELVLELTDLNVYEEGGVRRASACARLVYEPGTPGQPEIISTQSWQLTAPLGSVEAEDLRWYLEKFAIWPSEYFRNRARMIEQSLTQWGQLLHRVALPAAYTANVMDAWARIDGRAHRRFSVHVNGKIEPGISDVGAAASREATTRLLGLPWELLHDGRSFLFQGANPTSVRRRLPSTCALDVRVVSPPVRILLVTARPEDDVCGYIDHRVTAQALVQAMEALGGLARLHILGAPTLPAMRDELDRARRAGQPYQALHFDGHGLYDRRVGLGGLCFEHPDDLGKLEYRRHVTVFTEMLGPLLRDHRIQLVFLEACQTAQAENGSESVASELLKAGVTSVVAMTHSVLVETARRFVQAFYSALSTGARVGDAVLKGQRELSNDAFRGCVMGAGELRLQDWFIPVLFQEKVDPQLFSTRPADRVVDDVGTKPTFQFGNLPNEPDTGFVGRSRELLALQRLLHHDSFAIVRGQAGEGKTALAAEFARWMVRSHQIRRAVFVSVESHSHAAAVLDAIGSQLVADYSVATFDSMERATLRVESALNEEPTLLLVDNMESILLPPYAEIPQVLSEEGQRELDAILTLCKRLNGQGATRLVFTSREALPSPFHGDPHRYELGRLSSEDAVKLVERVLNSEAAGASLAIDATREAVEELVDVVHGHARTLALLGPALRSCGVAETQRSLAELMAEMDRQFPNSREKSLFASVELSLRRMSASSRKKTLVLGLFCGGVHLPVLRAMMGWDVPEVSSFARELVCSGLATPCRYNYISFNPALSPYVRTQIDSGERDALQSLWDKAMREHLVSLNVEYDRNVEMARTLVEFDLHNLIVLLERVHGTGDMEATSELATSLHRLLEHTGKRRVLEMVETLRASALRAMGSTWNHARFEAERNRIEQQYLDGELHDPLEGAQRLHDRARQVGENAYPEADYDLAMSGQLLARLLSGAHATEKALELLNDARERFDVIERKRPGFGARRAALGCLMVRVDCLRQLGSRKQLIVARKPFALASRAALIATSPSL